MGQYYYPMTVNTREYVYSHDFGSGLKLMEHSWVKNPFVQFVESLLVEGELWHGKPIVWAGDYADGELDENGKELENLHCMAKYKVTKPDDFKEKYYRYLINETKKQFVDKSKIPSEDGWKIHPLPLLTCEGNGRGGGDFRGESDLIGSWARDVITVSTKKPKGYDEVLFDLSETW